MYFYKILVSFYYKLRISKMKLYISEEGYENGWNKFEGSK